MSFFARLRDAWGVLVAPEQDDDHFPDSDGWTDRTPLDAGCPDTQPTSPGALDDNI